MVDTGDIVTGTVPVWDPIVRVGHWLLAVLFFAAFFTEDDLLTVHVWAGYGVGAYLIVRVIWGLIGTRHAQFADFAYGPAAAARYLFDLVRFRAKRHIGHSPAAAAMVYALLVSLTATTISGVALLAVEENAGPLAPWLGEREAVQQYAAGVFATQARASEGEDERDGDAEELLEEVHELFSDFSLALIILHIAGVALASAVHRENLVRAMITGRKRPL